MRIKMYKQLMFKLCVVICACYINIFVLATQIYFFSTLCLWRKCSSLTFQKTHGYKFLGFGRFFSKTTNSQKTACWANKGGSCQQRGCSCKKSNVRKPLQLRPLLFLPWPLIYVVLSRTLQRVFANEGPRRTSLGH